MAKLTPYSMGISLIHLRGKEDADEVDEDATDEDNDNDSKDELEEDVNSATNGAPTIGNFENRNKDGNTLCGNFGKFKPSDNFPDHKSNEGSTSNVVCGVNDKKENIPPSDKAICHVIQVSLQQRQPNNPISTSESSSRPDIQRKKKFKSLRLIDPIFSHLNRAIPSNSSSNSYNKAISNSFSIINRRSGILSKPEWKNKDIENILAKGDMNRLVLKSMWKNSQFDYVVKNSDENSRGIVAIWDNTLFTLSSSLGGDGFLAIVGNWYNINIPCLFIIVYAPQDQRHKRKLWKDITQLISIHNTLTILPGDFNEVWNVDERKGTMFDLRGDIDSSSREEDDDEVDEDATDEDNDNDSKDELEEDVNSASNEAPAMGNFENRNKDDCKTLKTSSNSGDVRILTCFHLASGLKVNFNKSKLFGNWVSNIELNVVASSLGCLASEFPCSYLGLPIGSQMSRCANWNPIVDKFQRSLSKWKGITFSIGGRLTLIKFVLGSLGVYYFSIFKAPKKVIHKLESIRRRFFWCGNSDQEKISWIAWKIVTLPRKSGGLGIGSLMDSNQSLLAKWWWRFRKEENALWCKVIRSIHGSSGGMLNTRELKKSSGTWSHIIKLKDDLNIIGINLKMLFLKKVGNGMTTSFWLPSRVNLDHRGIDLDSVRCPLCNDDIETETHAFVNCSLARCIWKDVFSWWQLPNTSITNLDDLFSLPDRITMESKLKPFFDVVVNASIWSLWSYRNKKKFAESEPYAIEELDKSIYDCQVALSECITKVEVPRKQIKDTEDLKAVVVGSSVETSTVESFVGALNARDVLYGPTVHALTFHDTAETIEDCDTYLGL
ncbi:putative RNA-directed DNA polymerase, eukaryota, reverse transcriptase zinc-binding domain protein [Tanacetum coccineum]